MKMSVIIGRKKEMTQIFDKKGKVIPCTILDVSKVRVVGERTNDKDGYESLILGIGEKKKANKVEKKKYKSLKFVPQKVLEFRKELLDKDYDYKVGDKIEADVFEVGQKVKATGITKGKGFQGVVKRWGFHGGPRTHGQSDRERAPGSIGAGTDPGRVFKGKKMPGHMGQKTKTILNLEIVKVDKEDGLICIKGSIPGGKGTLVKVSRMNKV